MVAEKFKQNAVRHEIEQLVERGLSFKSARAAKKTFDTTRMRRIVVLLRGKECPGSAALS